MSTMLIAFNGTRETGQFLGDQICSIKAAYLFAQNHPCGKYLLALSPGNEMNFLWKKFVDDFNCEIVYDTFHPGNMEQRFEAWSQWYQSREIEGRKFDIYKELHRRIDGGARQTILCGSEKGLGRKNIFEYFYYGQEYVVEPKNGKTQFFTNDVIYHEIYPPDRSVLISPLAKCQGNHIFTFEYWASVVTKLIDAGVTVTVNHNGNFCEQFIGHPLYRKIYPDLKGLVDEICRHKLVSCGNTGVGWAALACGIPLIAMQPPNSNMPDYRYEWCGARHLVEFLETPDPDYCARRIVEEVNRVTVFTTGCYDVIHAGHVRHLEESRAMGTRLIVGLNSDASVKRLKGEERPFNPESQRAKVLQSIRFVDEVRIFDGDDATDVIRSLRPDVITNGCDHKVESIVGKDFVQSYGGRVVVTSGTRDQSSTKIISAVVRVADVIKAVQDASSVSPNPWNKLKLLADQFNSVAGLPGDVADLGAYRGGCSLILRRLAPNKELHVFDTWAGNPFDDPLCHHKKGEWVARLDECKAIVGESERTHYHEGVFPGTAADLKDRMFSFVMIDPDTYPAVRDAIEFFWPRMVSGGKMLFDDANWPACQGVDKAINEFFSPEQQVRYPSLYACVVVKK